MLYPLVGNDYLVCPNFIGYYAIFFDIKIPDFPHTFAIIYRFVYHHRSTALCKFNRLFRRSRRFIRRPGLLPSKADSLRAFRLRPQPGSPGKPRVLLPHQLQSDLIGLQFIRFPERFVTAPCPAEITVQGALFIPGTAPCLLLFHRGRCEHRPADSVLHPWQKAVGADAPVRPALDEL